MDAFTLGLVWFLSVAFGAWTALAVVRALTGRHLFPLFSWRVAWSPGEMKVAGWAWAVCGMVGAVDVLYGGLIFGVHLMPVLGVGTPWVIFSNPWPLILLATLGFQFLIEQHHKRRWPFKA